MLVSRVAAYKLRITSFVLKMNIFDIVHHVRNTIEPSSPSHISQSLIPHVVDTLRFAQQERNVFE